MAFLDRGYCTSDQNIVEKPDLSICIDCGDADRFIRRKEKFQQSPITICIDHHGTTEFYCDYNYVDSKAAATGELIFKLLRAMDLPLDREMGGAIFAAITTDTGNFSTQTRPRKPMKLRQPFTIRGLILTKSAWNSMRTTA